MNNTAMIRAYLREREEKQVHILDICAALGLTRQQVAAILTRLIRDPRSGVMADGRGMYRFSPDSRRDTVRRPGKGPEFYYVGQSVDGYRLYADRITREVYAMVPVRAGAISVADPGGDEQ